MRKFADLISSLNNLKVYSTDRNYKQAAQILLSIGDLSNYFKTYEKIPQISDVLKEKEAVFSALKLQLRDEFSLHFKNMSSHSNEVLYDACLLAEALGKSSKDEIIHMAVETVLSGCRELYERRDNKTMESIEKRYAWFVRTLADFKTKYVPIFPHYWGILCFIIHEFCALTSIHVNEILQLQFINKKRDG